jgi:(S)-ureidoglycine aminohydrolase
MEISALTRSVVKHNHAVISSDGYVNSTVPGWTNCTVNVIINEQMGAQLCQTLVTCQHDARLQGATRQSQIFIFIIQGKCKATVSDETQTISSGQFIYIPVKKEYVLEEIAEGTRFLTFHKTYEYLEGHPVPLTIFGDATTVPVSEYLGDPALRLQLLLPDNLSFDMAVNIFTYDPGGHLPFVETHIMEHGLLYLQGQGIYMLDHQWYPVKKGDSIWMAPFCQQWFTAMGKEPAVYIYYKNVNRFPTKM